MAAVAALLVVFGGAFALNRTGDSDRETETIASAGEAEVESAPAAEPGDAQLDYPAVLADDPVFNAIGDIGGFEQGMSDQGVVIDGYVGSDTNQDAFESFCTRPVSGPIVGARWLLDRSTQEVLAVSPIWAGGASCIERTDEQDIATESGLVVSLVQGDEAAVAERDEFWSKELGKRGFAEEQICEVRSSYQVVLGLLGEAPIVEDGLDLFEPPAAQLSEPISQPSVRWTYLVTELEQESFELVVVVETSAGDVGTIALAESAVDFFANEDGVAWVVLSDIPKSIAPGGIVSLQEDLVISSADFGQSSHSVSIFPEACDLPILENQGEVPKFPYDPASEVVRQADFPALDETLFLSQTVLPANREMVVYGIPDFETDASTKVESWTDGEWQTIHQFDAVYPVGPTPSGTLERVTIPELPAGTFRFSLGTNVTTIDVCECRPEPGLPIQDDEFRVVPVRVAVGAVLPKVAQDQAQTDRVLSRVDRWDALSGWVDAGLTPASKVMESVDEPGSYRLVSAGEPETYGVFFVE